MSKQTKLAEVPTEVEEIIIDFTPGVLQRLKDLSNAEKTLENNYKEGANTIRSMKVDIVNTFIEAKGIKGNPRLTDDFKLAY